MTLAISMARSSIFCSCSCLFFSFASIALTMLFDRRFAMNSNFVIMPLISPFFTTRSIVMFSMVKRNWIFDIGVSSMTRKGELFFTILGSSKSIGEFQKFSTISLCTSLISTRSS